MEGSREGTSPAQPPWPGSYLGLRASILPTGASRTISSRSRHRSSCKGTAREGERCALDIGTAPRHPPDPATALPGGPCCPANYVAAPRKAPRQLQTKPTALLAAPRPAQGRPSLWGWGSGTSPGPGTRPAAWRPQPPALAGAVPHPPSSGGSQPPAQTRALGSLCSCVCRLRHGAAPAGGTPAQHTQQPTLDGQPSSCYASHGHSQWSPARAQGAAPPPAPPAPCRDRRAAQPPLS